MPRTSSKTRITVDEDRLIEVIKLNPELYDPDHANASDSNETKNIWKNISKELDAPVDACKKAWNKLKDNYLKDKNTQTNRRMSLRSSSTEKNLDLFDVPSVENSNENSQASSNCGSPKMDEKRRLRSTSRSLSQLTAISETDIASMASVSSADTIAANDELPLSAKAGRQSAGRTPRKLNFPSEVFSDNIESLQLANSTEKNLRHRLSEPSPLTSKEVLQSAVNSTPWRQSGGNQKMKKTPKPTDSTRTFFESMALTVSTFPQHVQAAMKVQICNIVFETEFDLSSPKTR